MTINMYNIYIYIFFDITNKLYHFSDGFNFEWKD